MSNIESFAELGLLLQETKWGPGDSPDAKIEGDFFVFPAKNKRVPRKDKFRFKLGEQEVEYSAEQIVYTYRTREQDLKTYLREPTKILSTLHRPNFIALFNDSNLIIQASKGTLGAGQETSRRDDERAGKRERLDDGRSKDKRGGDQQQKVQGPSRLSDFLRKEITYFDRNAALNAVRSFQEVTEWDEKSKQIEEEHAKRGMRQKKAKFIGSPIIIVPPNVTATINLLNIKSFLEDMRYVSAEEILAKNPNEQKPESVYVTRKKHPQAGDIRYKVVDSVLNFDSATWERVVAVFVSGQAWQFKGWGKYNTPAEILANIRGFYLYFDDAKLPDQVKNWNVVPLPIKHQGRMREILQVHEFWKQVDSHMERARPQLLQSLIDEHEARLRAEREARQKGLQALEDEDEEEEEDDLMVNRTTVNLA